MTTNESRTLLANINSDTMAENPTDTYLRAMAVVTPRMLWEASPGDCVVTLAPFGTAFLDYVASVIDLPIDQVEIIAPPDISLAPVLETAAELDALDRVAARRRLEPFVLDHAVLDFARRTGVRLHPYSANPDDSTLEVVRFMNTKSGFREIAAGLGLPIANGGFAAAPAELEEALVSFLADRQAAIIKPNRSSTGFGNKVIPAGSTESVIRSVRAALADQPARTCGWVYEEFLPFHCTPSTEVLIGDSGITHFCSCDQRTVNNAWTGMVAPAAAGEHLQALQTASMTIGRWLHDEGYRGIFDLDGGVHDGGLVVTETNVRLTAGIYLEKLARRLRPYDSPVHWRADSRQSRASIGFLDAVRRLAAAGLDGRSADARAVLTVDTCDLDGRWRYLVVGRDPEVVTEAERAVEELLEVRDP
jgi:hypothetical protein